jgi:hypothetical protein
MTRRPKPRSSFSRGRAIRPTIASPVATALMPPLEWMLGGTVTLISGFCAVKAAPTALRTSIPSQVPTTASVSAAEQGAAASVEHSANENRMYFIILPHATSHEVYRKAFTDTAQIYLHFELNLHDRAFAPALRASASSRPPL